MVEKQITSPRNVINLANYRQVLASGKASSMSARMCRHCGAPLLDGENDDDCSTAISTAAPQPRERSRRIRLD
ncbi:hypothetical protein IVB40_26625 [Bradyrhizobium sp. 40]|jgi:hypothetical protein|uniref:hypothetical protein n=1 Tax=unclassified Bradyrhizobium TaxID=2631580 RepID=UPI0004816335|nr:MULTISPECIES: hypothetical protein [unclassified Bradyrhizobium]MCK1368419.1 hypothetical protein [Bradyrhizobium sp. 62]MCK1397128.1 hypothetical protein [Bradyrhizobium sp. 39]MCK1752834.1 hypothetical protein [Bradyrhizobium sp. 135]UPJ37032.1 hypothetical protein IVB45_09440 [Bradyrhizobium sp. 4]UPJ40846.1 hypothetical protein IVB40_26625 [Bradyrhizobium sp. 40]